MSSASPASTSDLRGVCRRLPASSVARVHEAHVAPCVLGRLGLRPANGAGPIGSNRGCGGACRRPRSLVCTRHTSLPASLAGLAYAPQMGLVRSGRTGGVAAPAGVLGRSCAWGTRRSLRPWQARPTPRKWGWSDRVEPGGVAAPAGVLGRSCARGTRRSLRPWQAWPTPRKWGWSDRVEPGGCGGACRRPRSLVCTRHTSLPASLAGLAYAPQMGGSHDWRARRGSAVPRADARILARAHDGPQVQLPRRLSTRCPKQ